MPPLFYLPLPPQRKSDDENGIKAISRYLLNIIHLCPMYFLRRTNPEIQRQRIQYMVGLSKYIALSSECMRPSGSNCNTAEA